MQIIQSKIFISIFVGVLLVGGGWYALRGGGTAGAPLDATRAPNAPLEGSPTPLATSGAQKDVGTPGAFHGSLNDLIARGGNYQCTFTYSGPTSVSNGTVFIAGDRISGKFSTKVPQVPTTIDTFMVEKESSVYTWSSILPNQGFKSPVTRNITPDQKTPTANTQTFDGSQTVDYKCESWIVDESKFVLPPTVKFLETK